jgi:hypothetical protein
MKIVISTYSYGLLTDGFVNQSFQFTQDWTELNIAFQSIRVGNDNYNTFCSFNGRRLLLNETLVLNQGGLGLCTDNYPVILSGQSVLLQITAILKF